MRGLRDARIAVCGGASGIGAALVERLVEEGARLMVGDINERGLTDNRTKFERAGKTVLTKYCDLSDAASIDEFLEGAVSGIGGLDGLAITAADLSPGTLRRDLALEEMDLGVWERTFRVNLVGHALMMKAAIPHFRAASRGSIVVVSSGAASQGAPTMPAYAAAKAALQAIVRHVARIAGHDSIRCNAVASGLILNTGSNANPDGYRTILDGQCLSRFGTANDIAAVLAFLLSDDAGWITGQVISANGGFSFRD